MYFKHFDASASPLFNSAMWENEKNTKTVRKTLSDDKLNESSICRKYKKKLYYNAYGNKNLLTIRFVSLQHDVVNHIYWRLDTHDKIYCGMC